MTRRDRRHTLAKRKHPRERGMSLVELLLALSLLVVISVSLIAGIVMTRHAFQTERQAQGADSAGDATEALSHLVETAFPIVSLKDPKRPVSLFEGRPASLSFIALGDGRSLRGGLHDVKIWIEDDELVAEVTPTRETGAVPDARAGRRMVLLRGAATIKFRYFGPIRTGEKAIWRDDWTGAELQPLLASIEIMGNGFSAHPVAMVSAIRQR